jgi:magnesium-protoporphyrin O-methyltransferase
MLLTAFASILGLGARAVNIQPVAHTKLRGLIASEPALAAFQVGRSEKISSGFYASQAMELVRSA